MDNEVLKQYKKIIDSQKVRIGKLLEEKRSLEKQIKSDIKVQQVHSNSNNEEQIPIIQSIQTPVSQFTSTEILGAYKDLLLFQKETISALNDVIKIQNKIITDFQKKNKISKK